MKNKVIILVMLAAALQVSAQTNNRSRTSRETAGAAEKTEKAEQTRKDENSEKKAVTRERTVTESERNTPVPRTQPTKRETPGTSSSTSTQRRTTTINSTSQEPRSNDSRRSVEQRNVNTETRKESRDAHNSVPPSRSVTTPANTNRERAVNPANTQSTVNRSAQSVRGNEYTPKTGREYEQARRVYETPARKAVTRTTYVTTGHVYRPVEYRRVHHPYRAPVRVDLYWSRPMYREYRTLYPEFRYWYYPVGYRIHTVSTYDAGFYFGEVARVYGRVYATWYSRPTDEYYLYFGGPYPYQDFSLIIPGKIARRYNRRPDRFFTNRHLAVTGLISRWEGKPEMMARKRTQIEIY